MPLEARIRSFSTGRRLLGLKTDLVSTKQRLPRLKTDLVSIERRLLGLEKTLLLTKITFRYHSPIVGE